MSQILQSESNLSLDSFEDTVMDVGFETELCVEKDYYTELVVFSWCGNGIWVDIHDWERERISGSVPGNGE